MEEFLLKFIEHLFFVTLNFIFIWGIRKLFLNSLKNTIQSHIFYGTKEESIKMGKCGVKITNINKINSIHIPSTHSIGKFDWVDNKKEYFCIRIINPELEHRQQINSSIMLHIKPEEIPFGFGLKLFFLIIGYKNLPKIFKSGNMEIKASKKMLLVLENKIDKIGTFVFNLKNIEKNA